ncbi:MAG: excinuclease ABC subunit UvrA [Candidatus Portnoybacteria bacterium CG10_big_fil_rev_8_21_14_0_10_36_7]|uniref:UvrABC system protein A n=1 Tax=Candidatus Portnoybacteria bacterium CG10_big_fil_rev_8_21_14_0_10_36_7 TaxID=1974812 RepID=A0A2M8KF80_9BACT|nr:MAG: excinuclease ABC subunit UvrA [Candidatus Portnoybacteria bacterium CG10_big_fil_rev_8_21_14_0_10_36_7]
MQNIHIKNARVHNLKNISLDIPKNKLIVITGLSGSGKSSLAFDTIYAEGQRRYAESLNAYARQFMDMQDKPDVDEMQGLSPTIAIHQRNTTQNPRSTVGTTTELYDYLRLLFARIGIQYCPDCHEKIPMHSNKYIIERARNAMKKNKELILLSPIIKREQVDLKNIRRKLEKTGYPHIRINGVETHIKQLKKYNFNLQYLYDIDIILGKAQDIISTDIIKEIETALDLSNGRITLYDEHSDTEEHYSSIPSCPRCHRVFATIESRSFSFNSPHGACPRCTGLGKTLEIDPELIVPNQKLTIAEGAIQPWMRLAGNSNHYIELLTKVAETHDFSIHTPLEELSQTSINSILYGTDGEQYILGSKTLQYEGVIPHLTARYVETKSDYLKKEMEVYMREKICSICHGKRLKQDSLHIKITDLSIADMVEMSIEDIQHFFYGIEKKSSDFFHSLSNQEQQIITPIAKEINRRIIHMSRVGLSYITLDRPLYTLSGGEAQRVRLSTQLSAGLSGLIYILDEPSIGLHAKDNDHLIDTLKSLRDMGNTVIVVEHDHAIMKAADYLIDIGPGAGEYGGEIMASGTPQAVKKTNTSLTGRYLNGTERIIAPKKIRTGNGKYIHIEGAKAHNLKNIDVAIPLGLLVSISGVSGSGKSTLILDILSKALAKKFYRAKAEPGAHKRIKGLSNIDKIIAIDQTPIGRTPRSNPATYTGVFTLIRDLYAELPEAKIRGYSAGTFSFNVKGDGRCEACSGEGYMTIPMHFLNDVYTECSECNGTRYTAHVLEIHYKEKNIAEVLAMTIEEAFLFFMGKKNITEKLQVLRNVGLGYLQLGQPATTLSGGEAQRIKLATELSRRSTGKTLYILDEPSTGLHFEDIKKLLHVLNQLVDKGNTVLVIEHNLDIIKCSDWIIDLGPEGGKRGGEVVAEGTPRDIITTKKSITGKYLKSLVT